MSVTLEELVGRHVLVGLTFEDPAAGTATQEQLHGTVDWVHPTKGIGLTLLGPRAGESYVLPPDTRSIRPAPPGDYRLRATGEVVTNPDFLATWTVVSPGTPEAPE